MDSLLHSVSSLLSDTLTLLTTSDHSALTSLPTTPNSSPIPAHLQYEYHSGVDPADDWEFIPRRILEPTIPNNTNEMVIYVDGEGAVVEVGFSAKWPRDVDMEKRFHKLGKRKSTTRSRNVVENAWSDVPDVGGAHDDDAEETMSIASDDVSLSDFDDD